MFRYSLLAFLASGTFLQRAYFDYAFSIVACLVILGRIAQKECAGAILLEVDPTLEDAAV
jgi:hypothetical protein